MNIYTYVMVGMSASFILSLSLIFFYLRYKKNILHQQYLIKAAEVLHQKALTHAIINSQEEERRRIGMDLHDQIGSTLASLRLGVEHFTEEHKDLLSISDFNNRCKRIIDKAINDTRNISHNLSPTLNNSYGFYELICDHCQDVVNTGKLNINLEFPSHFASLLPSSNHILALYRVIAELINNTIKHAKASFAYLSFRLGNNELHIDYGDNGIGLDQKTANVNKGMGMQNIESRLGMIGANYKISQPNNGFHISITLILVSYE